ncbi:zinc finger E-box-binding homeobox 1 [Trichinella spiralis]|uniref:zinc finger E-box-binding homeobox 1 n=1 Tax=Trichinella spiralis TaxID=6334 RepID=UPI0001EFCA61|nr:zinc finger E-box-binding homeobox 1 [Trichinella spiralis]
MKTGDYSILIFKFSFILSICLDDDLEDSLQIDEPSDVNSAEVSVNTECPAPLSEDTGENVLNEEQEESKGEETET